MIGFVGIRIPASALAALLAGACAATALAAEERFPQRPHQSDMAAVMPECTCRNRGRDVSVGETSCVNGMIATCVMLLNNTSWSVSGQACPDTPTN